MRAACLCVLLAGSACADDEPNRIERTELNDEGALCVRTGMAGELLIDVVVDGCASGCARVVEAACEVEVQDDELVVHGFIAVQERRGPDAVCPANCVPIGVSCAATQVSPGDYSFRYGDDTSSARLPIDMPLLLGGSGAGPELGCR